MSPALAHNQFNLLKTKFHSPTPPALLKEARKTAKKAIKFSKRFKNNLPHSLRELALIEAHVGKLTKAFYYLDESLRISESQGARYETAQTRLARGRLKLATDPEAANSEIQLATRMLVEVGANLEFHGVSWEETDIHTIDGELELDFAQNALKSNAASLDSTKSLTTGPL